MITCKEDLINTYIENDFGELLKSYIRACNRLGVEVRNSVDWYDFRFVMVSSDCDVHFLNTTNYKPTGKQLTLSDLKLLTRTEYEKVTESIFDLRDEFERGELYCKLGDELIPVPNETQLSMLLDHGRCYRRIEKPVNWREDVYEWQHTAKIGVYTPLDFFVSDLIKSHPGKFLEMCRVALRANGEIE